MRCFVHYEELIFCHIYLIRSTDKIRSELCTKSCNVIIWHTGTCIYLSSKSDHGLNVKTYNELNEIGRRTRTNQVHLLYLYQFFVNLLSCHFWMRDHIKVVELGEKHKPTGHKRILEVIRTFVEGIACLALTCQTNESKWRKTGEDALGNMLK